MQPAYTFGECDLYTALQAGQGVRMWMLKKLGFVLPVFWGPRWCVCVLVFVRLHEDECMRRRVPRRKY